MAAICGGFLYDFYTVAYGRFQPRELLDKARKYAEGKICTATQSMQVQNVDYTVSKFSGKHILKVLNREKILPAMYNIFGKCSAVAAWITIDVDKDMVMESIQLKLEILFQCNM